MAYEKIYERGGSLILAVMVIHSTGLREKPTRSFSSTDGSGINGAEIRWR
jgi:hypothetical protein